MFRRRKSGVTESGTEFETFFWLVCVFFHVSADGAEVREERINVKTSLLSQIPEVEG